MENACSGPEYGIPKQWFLIHEKKWQARSSFATIIWIIVVIYTTADMRFIYLHGFASSPRSKKAKIFKKEFERRGIPLAVPNLDGGNFIQLTLSGQIALVKNYLDACSEERVGLIGSSMGGYLASLVAQEIQQVLALYLMAPGFNFLSRWRDRLGIYEGGRQQEYIRVYHYDFEREMDLSTEIFLDAQKWEQVPLNRNLPTRLVHGIHDDTVPIDESRHFANNRPWCDLVELDSDHGLFSHVNWIVNDCLNFFQELKN